MAGPCVKESDSKGLGVVNSVSDLFVRGGIAGRGAGKEARRSDQTITPTRRSG